ncbi:MAG: TraC family protein [Halarcobacter sp.]
MFFYKEYSSRGYLTRENLQEILERETISEFLNLENYAQSDNEVGVFYCRNGYRGYCFEIFPPAKPTYSLHDDILGMYSQALPSDAAIQITHLPSRNIKKFFDLFENTHKNPQGLTNPENVINLIKNNVKWMTNAINNSLIKNRAMVLRPRNYRTIVTVMIPQRHNKKMIKDSGIVDFALKTKNRLKPFAPKALNADEMLTVLNEMLRPNESDCNRWDTKYNENKALFLQILSSSDTIEYDSNDNGYIEIKNRHGEKTYATVLTTKSFPNYMTVDVGQGLFFNANGKEPKNQFSCPYFINSTTHIVSKESIKKKEENKARGNMYQAEMVGEKGMKYFQNLKRRAAEAEELLTVLSGNESISKTQWTLCMFANTKEELAENVEAAITEFEKKDWILQQEVEIAVPMLLYSLPFQFDLDYKKWSQKFDTTLKSNTTVLAPAYADFASFGTAQRGMPLFGRQGQIQYFDPFDKTFPGNNAVVAAPTRSGKTFWATHFIASSLALGRKIVFIELQETLAGVVEAFGGKYIRFDEKRKICVNFFTDIKLSGDGKSIHNDAMIMIIPLIGLMMQKKLIAGSEDPNRTSETAVLSSYIETAVNSAFADKGTNTGMYEVNEELKKIAQAKIKEGARDSRLDDAIIALKPYSTPDGTYYPYFNGQKTEYFNDNNFVVLGLSALQDKGALFDIVLMALTQSVTNEYFMPQNASIEKLLIVDEAWSILSNPIFAHFMIKVWRTLNKFNGAGISISQDISQYFDPNAPELEALFNNSTYKIYFRQDGDVVDRLVKDKKLPENQLFIKDLKSLRTVTGEYSETMIYTNDGYTISRTISSKYSFYLYSNRDGAPEVYKMMDKFNISKHQASWILEFVDIHQLNSLDLAIEAYDFEYGVIGYEKISDDLKQLLSQNAA